jgi:hypothetical protein
MLRLRTWRRAAAILVAVQPIGSVAGPSTVVPFPRDYETALVKYAVVDRSDGTSRDLYVSPPAVDALRRDPRTRELPVGVLFALDVWSAEPIARPSRMREPRFPRTADGHLARTRDERTLHLMMKIRPGSGSQNWAFNGFDPRTAAPLKLELPGDCLLCHQAAVVNDMVFSLPLLARFAATGQVQYKDCQHPGRQLCPF